MESHLQLCTVALVATLAWPVCYLCGASLEWQRFHFVFLCWAWLLLGGFAGACSLTPWLESLEPVEARPLAWFGLVVVISLHVVVAWLWLAPTRKEWLAMRQNGYEGLRRHQVEHGERGIDP